MRAVHLSACCLLLAGCYRDLEFAPCREDPANAICLASDPADAFVDGSDAAVDGVDGTVETFDAEQTDTAIDVDASDASDAETEPAFDAFDATSDAALDSADTAVDADAEACVINACGGCNVLSPAKDSVCGVCSSGKYVCNGANATKCSDPVTTPAPGTACGTCGKSTYTCTSGGAATACTAPDDRADATDTYFSNYSNDVWPMATGQTLGETFTLRRTGSVTKVVLGLKATIDDAAGAVGTFRVRLIKGYPTLSPSPTDVLATMDVVASTLPGAAPFVITLPAPTPSMASGTHLWLELTDQSPRYVITVLGGPRTAPSDHAFWLLDGSTTPAKWIEYPLDFAYLQVGLRGCF